MRSTELPEPLLRRGKKPSWGHLNQCARMTAAGIEEGRLLRSVPKAGRSIATR
jgi:hypothetical protein